MTYKKHPNYDGVIGYFRYLVYESGSPTVKLEVVEDERIGEEHTIDEWRKQ